MCTLSYNFICQLYLSKSGGKKRKNIVLEVQLHESTPGSTTNSYLGQVINSRAVQIALGFAGKEVVKTANDGRTGMHILL